MEILITISIITVGMLGTSYLFSTGFRQVIRSKVKLPTAWIAQDLMEEILSKKFNDLDAYNGRQENPPKTIEGDAMDGSIPAGQTEPLPDYRSFRRSARVEYVNPITLEPPNPVPPNYTTDYKKINVEVMHSAAGNFSSPDFTYRLNQIVARHE